MVANVFSYFTLGLILVIFNSAFDKIIVQFGISHCVESEYYSLLGYDVQGLFAEMTNYYYLKYIIS